MVIGVGVGKGGLPTVSSFLGGEDGGLALVWARWWFDGGWRVVDSVDRGGLVVNGLRRWCVHLAWRDRRRRQPRSGYLRGRGIKVIGLVAGGLPTVSSFLGGEDGGLGLVWARWWFDGGWRVVDSVDRGGLVVNGRRRWCVHLAWRDRRRRQPRSGYLRGRGIKVIGLVAVRW
ncbi:hypothetical protein Dimus_008400 [Dionaea muscipula]